MQQERRNAGKRRCARNLPMTSNVVEERVVHVSLAAPPDAFQKENAPRRCVDNLADSVERSGLLSVHTGAKPHGGGTFMSCVIIELLPQEAGGEDVVSIVWDGRHAREICEPHFAGGQLTG